ncbi:hypothetical protein [Mesorhizobium sp. SP-1A]|uniref:hypothetical protein n=1 Tax=Mesorhizobium sp. SP-1A TaxID=3077840 RepID=UPI0028F7217D|nr:hypothetical protein [Mesorhizobium sp. SP-1A]
MILFKMTMLTLIGAFASFFVKAAFQLYAPDFEFLGGAFFGASIVFIACYILDKEEAKVGKRAGTGRSIDHD